MRQNIVFLLLFLLLIALIVYAFQPQTSRQRTSKVVPHLSPPTEDFPRARSQDYGCESKGSLPDPECTPGAVFPDVTSQVSCVPGYAKKARKVSKRLKDRVYREYGIYSREPGQYQVDHLVPLKLGGSNDIANLWPSPAQPRPGYHEKDDVEDYLQREVCSGRMPLKEAQAAIARDWVAIYKKIQKN